MSSRTNSFSVVIVSTLAYLALESVIYIPCLIRAVADLTARILA